MWRAVILTIGLMLSLGVVIPLLTDSTEASRPRQQRKYKKYKKYSKGWWRAYHRRQRQRRALMARKRALKSRQENLARAYGNEQNSDSAVSKTNVKEKTPLAVLPSGGNAPASWKQSLISNTALQYRVDDDGGNPVGSAQISVVGPAVGADSDTFRNKAVGGVSTSALRRTVIDRMMKEDGWVVNDYQKDMNGKKVYVVVAQSKGANNQVQSRLFYFTEVEGKIYSVATSAPNESSERLARESERVINSLQGSGRPAQAQIR